MYLHQLYKDSLCLLTDFYELTMAYGYWKQGLADREAVFHLCFRKKPFGGEFALAAGLAPLMEWIEHFRYSPSDLDYIASLTNDAGEPLFEPPFVRYLAALRLTCSIDAAPEGTAIFPQEPMVRVQGPLLQAQLLESALLNLINFPSLIATKAARICQAAAPDPVIEFGLRRAQGIDGAVAASRAAYIGGCEGTSHVLAGKLLGIPVRGTHAHSWIMAFADEEESFASFAQVLPRQCIFLVDTYDTRAGVEKAIRVAQQMRRRGSEMAGVRLDSGDLGPLSIEIRALLDAAGFPEAKIMASNELDEGSIRSLKQQGARISLWGVGTHLVTGKEQPALDGVYKLSMLKNGQGAWEYKLKLSEQRAKSSTPGIQQVRRYFTESGAVCDLLYDTLQMPTEPPRGVPLGAKSLDLLVPIFREGKRVYDPPSLAATRAYAARSVSLFPRDYSVRLEESLHEKKEALIRALEGRR